MTYNSKQKLNKCLKKVFTIYNNHIKPRHIQHLYEEYLLYVID